MHNDSNVCMGGCVSVHACKCSHLSFYLIYSICKLDARYSKYRGVCMLIISVLEALHVFQICRDITPVRLLSVTDQTKIME